MLYVTQLYIYIYSNFPGKHSYMICIDFAAGGLRTLRPL